MLAREVFCQTMLTYKGEERFSPNCSRSESESESDEEEGEVGREDGSGEEESGGPNPIRRSKNSWKIPGVEISQGEKQSKEQGSDKDPENRPGNYFEKNPSEHISKKEKSQEMYVDRPKELSEERFGDEGRPAVAACRTRVVGRGRKKGVGMGGGIVRLHSILETADELVS